MTKQQASKKKATRATKPKAKAAKPAAEQPEQVADEVANEQAERKQEKQQEPSAEEKSAKKTKRKNPAKKSKPQAAAEVQAEEGSKKEAGESAEQEEKASKPIPVQEKKARPKTKRKPKAAKSKPAPDKEAPVRAEQAEGPAKEQAKAEAEEQKDVQAEVTAEPTTKPKSKPRRKKKKKVASAPEPEAATAEEPAAAPEEDPRGRKKQAKKKSQRPEPEQEPRVKRVIIASQNPAKIQAAELGFSRMFPEKEFTFEGVSVGSGVSDQPMSDDETFAGALNRALSARQEQEEGDFWIGLEGGLQEEGDDFFAFAWIVVLDKEGVQGKSRTGTFAIPPAVTELVRNGKELGEADDIVFEQTNSKQSSGAIGILTHGILDRAHYYAEAVLMALIPFKNPSLYVLEEVVEED